MRPVELRHRRQAVFRIVILTVVGIFMITPLFALFKFSIASRPGRGRWGAWEGLATDPDMFSAILTSLELTGLTVVAMLILLVPSMIWVRLKVPQLERLVEFLCLLPLTIPAIVVVVGIKNVMSWVNYLVTPGPLSLTFPYVILVLPYCYRALDAAINSVDLFTYSQAARSLGASRLKVFLRIIIPNIKNGILNAVFLAVMVVLGEYTFASLLAYDNLQVVIQLTGMRDTRLSTAASVATLAFGFVLLFGLSAASTRRKRRRNS